MIGRWMRAGAVVAMLAFAGGAQAAQAPPAAKPKSLTFGTYECFVNGSNIYSDIVLKTAHDYADSDGAKGAYSYSPATGRLTFSSGPLAGHGAQMINARTIGVADRGSTRLGTQCELMR